MSISRTASARGARSFASSRRRRCRPARSASSSVLRRSSNRSCPPRASATPQSHSIPCTSSSRPRNRPTSIRTTTTSLKPSAGPTSTSCARSMIRAGPSNAATSSARACCIWPAARDCPTSSICSSTSSACPSTSPTIWDAIRCTMPSGPASQTLTLWICSSRSAPICSSSATDAATRRCRTRARVIGIGGRPFSMSDRSVCSKSPSFRRKRARDTVNQST
mmetsp:Transcript_20712/g.57561  ORF Transcript_20712/g.57561 Transcript_20712/m.57561 type:complete len:221 (+) Transcript_20712:147-809(+)